MDELILGNITVTPEIREFAATMRQIYLALLDEDFEPRQASDFLGKILVAVFQNRGAST